MCDWSSDVCSSDLRAARISARFPDRQCRAGRAGRTRLPVRGVSMRLTVDHTTRYTYDGPVGYALQQLRLTPKDRPGQQQVRDWTIAVEGGEAQLHYSDHLGNGVDLIAVADRKSTRLNSSH